MPITVFFYIWLPVISVGFGFSTRTAEITLWQPVHQLITVNQAVIGWLSSQTQLIEPVQETLYLVITVKTLKRDYKCKGVFTSESPPLPFIMDHYKKAKTILTLSPHFSHVHLSFILSLQWPILISLPPARLHINPLHPPIVCGLCIDPLTSLCVWPACTVSSTLFPGSMF